MQSLFFKSTSKITPKPPEDAFDPPEEKQRSEPTTKTVARRGIEDLMQRGPVAQQTLERGAELVHYGFGALWGGVYGVCRESLARRPGLLAIAGYSTLVWAASDNVILPLFKLAAWPTAYPLKSHAYALSAHLAYGLAVASAYETLTAVRSSDVVATLFLGTRRRGMLSSILAIGRDVATQGISAAQQTQRVIEERLSDLGVRS
jgi:hypothetical protein